MGHVCDDKMHVHPIPLHTAFFHHPTNPESPVLGGFAGRNLRWRKEEHQVFFKGIKHQRGGSANDSQRSDNQSKSFMSWFHGAILSIC